MIFANHAHVFREEIRPHGSPARLNDYLDECGISKAVAFAPFAGRGSTQVLGPDDDPNVWLAGELKKYPRFVGFGTVNFEEGDLFEQVRKIAGLGLRGIKIHPAHQTIHITGPEAYEVYGAAQDCGLFLSFHTGVHYHRLSDYAQLLFDDVAWDFPGLSFSMEHIGGYCFFKDSVAVMTNQRKAKDNPRIFAGWTSIFERGSWHISERELLELMDMTGENAHIFGLDFPYKSAEYTRGAIEFIRGLPVSDGAKEKILGGNLARVLAL